MTTLIPSAAQSFIKKEVSYKGERTGIEQKPTKKLFANRKVKINYATLIKVLAITILRSPKDILSRLITICPMIGRDVINFLEKTVTKATDTMSKKVDKSRDNLVQLAEQEQDLTHEQLLEADQLFTEELRLMQLRNTATNRLEKIRKTADFI